MSSNKRRSSGKADRPADAKRSTKSRQLSGFIFNCFGNNDLEPHENSVPLSPSSPVPLPIGAAENTSVSTSAQLKSQVPQIPGSDGPPPPPPPPPPLPHLPLLPMPRTQARAAARIISTSTQPTYPAPSAGDAPRIAANSVQSTSSVPQAKKVVSFGAHRAVRSFYVDGCFGGESKVHLSGGDFKPVSELRKGDLIKCDFEGNTAEVVCVMVLPVPKGEITMAKFENGLVITPMHPVVSGGAWALPNDLVKPSGVKLCQLFNFVLDRQHTILVNGVVCAALGHRREGHTAHPFWGNWDTIVNCLKRIDRDGYTKGLVEVLGTMRKKDSGMVYGLRGTTGQLVTAEG
ncbi:hypothetical protein N431DRAFT_433530 [Stipitochalara longipes BDJ]|nr:hypothetical protein N431DRAFT_433530 [Stipitochalara longipes BDJ]